MTYMDGDLASFQKCAQSLWRLPAEILKSCLAGSEGLVPFTPQAFSLKIDEAHGLHCLKLADRRHRIHPHRSLCRKIGRQQRHRREQNQHGKDRHWVIGADAVQQTGDDAGQP
jgi:hypothetical protein